jgi:RHS repeat-associated protein
VTANYTYAPYGTTSSTGTANASFQFSGRENDGASKLYYYRTRYYSAQTGRFISQDPIGLLGGINVYAYASGNPISLTDPSGLYATPWHDFMSSLALLLSGGNPFDNGYVTFADMASDFDWYRPGAQDPANSNWHSMAQPGQSAECAKAGAQAYINSQVATGTLKGLGFALHANEDSFARGHGYAVWDGDLTFAHVWADWTPTLGELQGAVSTDMAIIQSFRTGTVPFPGNAGCGCQ